MKSMCFLFHSFFSSKHRHLIFCSFLYFPSFLLFILLDLHSLSSGLTHNQSSPSPKKASKLPPFHPLSPFFLLFYILSHRHSSSRSTAQHFSPCWTSAAATSTRTTTAHSSSSSNPTTPSLPTPGPRTHKHLHLIRQNPPPLLNHYARSPTADYCSRGGASRRPILGGYSPRSLW